MFLLVGRTRKLRSFSTAAAQPYLLVRERETLPTEVAKSLRIGSSKGWVALTDLQNSKLRFTNLFNPCASSPTTVTLPPLDGCYRGSVARVSKVSLSASPNQRDCVVAAKLFAPVISLCRPGDSEWTHIETPNHFFTSAVMHSMRDQKFYLHSPDTAPTDLIKTCSDFPLVSPYRRFPFSEIPKTAHDLYQSSLFRTQYLVESPSGDSFIVIWCMNSGKIEEETSRLRCETKGFMVFKQDHGKKLCSYTQDIGYLCIFLGKNESFCVSATKYPGLNPNSVYFEGSETGFGFYELSSNTVHDLTHLAPFSAFYLWLAPLE
uniref:KIB1-4 beta-propeller domain-containing protein n=1 Tax=Brassica oleracea var. oleracea TaxID=109376 RepID=A0A0D3C6J6_BRAOL